MKIIATVLFLSAAFCALAAANPVPSEDLYISFDPAGGRMHEIDPAPNTTIRAYIVLDMSPYTLNGMTVTSFRLSDPREDFPGVFTTATFVNLLDIAVGDWNEGITLASTTCRQSWPLVIGRLDCFYLGGPASICIFDHPDYPHWVVDCTTPDGVVWLYDGTASGLIAGGDGICEQAAPVEDVTWGTIKAMFRQ